MRVYNKFRYELEMPSTYNDEFTGEKMRGIESYLPKDIYRQDVHHQRVAENIVSNLPKLSKNGKFHAILATENIPEAIEYYNLFKKQYPSLRVAAVFDNSTEHSDEGIAKEQTLREMLLDYNQKYGTSFSVPTYALYKKDVAKRLAHKKPYLHIEHDMQIDLLIVVTQMLTGFDSKWVNTLYLDKLMKYVDLIQSSHAPTVFWPR
jgi:type I restriction enzyme R subunit